MPSLNCAQLLLKLVIEYQDEPPLGPAVIEYDDKGNSIEHKRECSLWSVPAWRERAKTTHAPWDRFADPDSKIGLDQHAQDAIRATIRQVSPRNPALRRQTYMIHPQIKPHKGDLAVSMLTKNAEAKAGVTALTKFLQARWQKEWHIRSAVKEALEMYNFPLWKMIDDTGAVRRLFLLFLFLLFGCSFST